MQAPDIDPDRLVNTSDIVARDEALQYGSEDSQHTGMFGLKGTLRDVSRARWGRLPSSGRAQPYVHA